MRKNKSLDEKDCVKNMVTFFFTELDEIGAANQIGNDLCTTFETTHPDNL